MKNLTRRDFIRLCGTSSIGLALTACGVTPTPTAMPAPTNTTLPSSTPLPTATVTLTNTPSPTSTATATATATATPKPPTLRSVGEKLGVLIGTSATGGDQYRDPRYVKALNEHFSVLFNFSNFLQRYIDTTGAEFRRLATANNQILYIHPGFFPTEDRETWLKNVRKEEVRPLMEKRVRVLLGFVEKVDAGTKPTFINFTNEAFFYDNASSAGGVVSPYRDFFGDKFISETYLMFYRAAKEMGLQIGKDLRMIYSDADIQKPGGKSDFVLQKLLIAKREVAANLGIPEQDVQLDVAPHFYQPLDERMNWYRRPLPTKDEIIENFKRFSQIGRVHVTEFSVLGTKNQAEINQGLVRVMTAAVQSGVCDSINFWLALRVKPTPEQQADIFFSQLGLFDSDYNPTDTYRALLQALMELPPRK